MTWYYHGGLLDSLCVKLTNRIINTKIKLNEF